ncbi:MAG: transcriptional repressor LexA [Spirochaetaceae bacterium]|jgi:repressor LexA|nr:transcriptional repressor LexA [Spirochaetaceae bacterium]
MKTLTDRQKEVLSFLVEFNREHSFPPTIREICANFGISIRAVQDHLLALEKKGYIIVSSGEKKHSRCIRILQKKRESQGFGVALRVPIVGSVAAGKPIMSEENYDGHISIAAADLKPSKSYFALRVKGESMIGAGILDGDIAIIEKQCTAENGQIAVVLVDGAITLKRFYRDADRIRLVPENPDFPVQVYDDAAVAGVLFRIERKY